MRIVVWVALLLPACTGGGGKDSPDSGSDDDDDTASSAGCTLSGIVESGSLVVTAGNVPAFATVDATLAEAADVSIWATATDAPDVTATALTNQSGAVTSPLAGFRPELDYTVHLRADTADGCEEVTAPFTTAELGGVPPEFDLLQEDPSFTGYLMVAYTTTGDNSEGIALVDGGGGVVWNWQNSLENYALHFAEPTLDGSGLLAVFNNNNMPEVSHVSEIDWDAQEAFDLTVDGAHHSATQKVPGARFAVLQMVRQDVPGFGEMCGTDSDSVLGDAIVEVQSDGTITQVWNVFDHVTPSCHDFLQLAGDVNDWTHLNAIDYDPAHDWWLVSSYWLGQVWIVDRSSGDVLYRIGSGDDADCRYELERQHGAEFTSSGIAVFNNNHDPSQMLEFWVDIDAIAAGTEPQDCAVTRSYDHPLGQTALTMGDIDVVGGSWYTAWGDDGDLMILDVTSAVPELKWHAVPTADYEGDHGGFVAESIASLPDLYFAALAQ